MEGDGVVIKGGSREMVNVRVIKEEFPLRVSKSSVQALHNQAIISLVGSCELWAIVAEVHKIAVGKKAVKHGYASAVRGGVAEHFMLM